jgi:hypothetical protein
MTWRISRLERNFVAFYQHAEGEIDVRGQFLDEHRLQLSCAILPVAPWQLSRV